MENSEPIETLKTLSDLEGEKTLKDFSGYIVDENQKPLYGVAITIGNKTTVTDSIGHFIINNANVDPHSANIEANKDGYRDYIQSVIPNDKNEVRLILESNSTPCLFWFCKHNHSLIDSNS